MLNMYSHIDKLNVPRSDIPAITHVDYSARVQTVDGEHQPAYYDVIRSFREKTGYGVIVNTSFNVRGEPIVCTPQDAYLCFMRTEMDVLVLENLVLFKEEQPPLEGDEDWRELYELSGQPAVVARSGRGSLGSGPGRFCGSIGPDCSPASAAPGDGFGGVVAGRDDRRHLCCADPGLLRGLYAYRTPDEAPGEGSVGSAVSDRKGKLLGAG